MEMLEKGDLVTWEKHIGVVVDDVVAGFELERSNWMSAIERPGLRRCTRDCVGLFTGLPRCACGSLSLNFPRGINTDFRQCFINRFLHKANITTTPGA